MNINASIVDQRLEGLVEDHKDALTELVGPDAIRQKSLAFVLLSVMTSLELAAEEAFELLTEGGNDVGVDAIHLGDVDDGEFTVTIFQGKYTHKNFDAESNFPENGIKNAINMVSVLFDPSKSLSLNERLKPRIEEVRSLIRDGYIPNVRLMLCNNGKKWKKEAQDWIDQSGMNNDQIQWVYYNHDNIVEVLQRKKTVKDTVTLSGKAIIEDFNFRRVLVGKIAVREIAELFNRNHDLLLERNIRRYLGLHSNRVNTSIHETLSDTDKQSNFYFFNNGITMVCQKFRHNALQGDNYQLKLENIQIINGGQTCKTIQQTLNEPDNQNSYDNVYVLLRLYELAEDDQGFIQEITYATNSQNPVDLRDLRSNDQMQYQLEIGINQLGYTYKRYRDDIASNSNQITSSITAESVMAVWRKKPHQSKFRRRELFGKLYEAVFKDLNAAQAVLAVLIFRIAENERKRPTVLDPVPDFLPYSAHYMAMIVGQELLLQNKLTIDQVSHKEFEVLIESLEENKAIYLKKAADSIKQALSQIYGEREISLQQLSATFRRGDLLEFLQVQTKQVS
ncbi:AIPR family protein [Hydrogenovibrio halophilus]|uniref:AIPR family protein n=1 Tax=Hydrogenovibrio halophilus TaxID=373391 RepID=UPI00037A8704|nr:AIPR family protein [Hydrogenovibrio halophilus]